MKSRKLFFLAVSAAGACLALARPALAFVDVPVHNSLPGAPASLYLNFNGDFTASLGPYTNITTPAYDLDGDPLTLSTFEKNTIDHIWSGVAEKYSPFDINVTTVDPGNRTAGQTMMIDIGGDGAWTGSVSGGISSVGGFLNGNTTGFVFPKNLGPTLAGHPKYVADAASHEAGHGFGLQHQSKYDPVTGQKLLEYNDNGGSGFANPTDRAPIMGLSYFATRSQWWQGTSSVSQNIIQSDMSIIGSTSNAFGFRPDDHPNSYNLADPIAVAPDYSFTAQGVIENTSDVDMLKFVTPGGTATIFGNDNVDDPMLDMTLQLLDSGGNVIATSAQPATIDPASLEEIIQATLAPGTYEIAVSSANLNYGDVGQYFLSGSVVPEPSILGGLLCSSLLLMRRRSRS